MPDSERQRITVAILALGGQGGGVLADWIAEVGRRNGYVAQGTSVPGVAQRTGATVYYVELFPRERVADGAEPVLALMPLPGDVDIVVASELMETGRSILRGFVTSDRTTLIGSTHRVYAISEKSALADGRASGERILEAATQRAKRFIGFDMDDVASRHGSVISSVMFGALAGSGALPFARSTFEEAIEAGGKAVASNLAAFGAGFEAALGRIEACAPVEAETLPTTSAGKALVSRIRDELPQEAHDFATEGVRRLMDYQDPVYAEFYLDRLRRIRAVDGGGEGWRITRETARYLALWMSYEDTIRVADLKVRGSRFDRVRDEVKAKPDQIIGITEYMHPRLEEVCETLPPSLGRRILHSRHLARRLRPLFRKGRHVNTSSLKWFVVLATLAGLRRWRRGTWRYRVEQERIEAWLQAVEDAARHDQAAAAELVECQRLIKGYSDTFERGLANFTRIFAAWEEIRRQPDAAATLKRLREAALTDDEARALDSAMADLRLAS